VVRSLDWKHVAYLLVTVGFGASTDPIPRANTPAISPRHSRNYNQAEIRESTVQFRLLRDWESVHSSWLSGLLSLLVPQTRIEDPSD
jgi:hypothetical protein